MTHSCARWLQYKEVLNISTVHQPRRLQRYTLPVLCLSKKRLSTVSYQASSSSSICFLLDGRYISRLSTFYFQGSIFANFLSFSFYPFFFFPHGCRRYMLCFIFILVKISISFVSKVFLTLSNLIHKNQQMSVAPLLWWLTIWSLSTNYLLQMLLLYSWTFFRKSERALIGYFEVTWNLTMNCFPSKSQCAKLQYLWR